LELVEIMLAGVALVLVGRHGAVLSALRARPGEAAGALGFIRRRGPWRRSPWPPEAVGRESCSRAPAPAGRCWAARPSTAAASPPRAGRGRRAGPGRGCG